VAGKRSGTGRAGGAEEAGAAAGGRKFACPCALPKATLACLSHLNVNTIPTNTK